MSQPQGEMPQQPATARAEELLERLGKQIGLFAGRAGQHIQSAATYIREEADRMDRPQTAPGEKPHSPPVARANVTAQEASEKAEEMVDRVGQRLAHFTAAASRQIQKGVALAREEAEDMWAEAQNIRQRNNR